MKKGFGSDNHAPVHPQILKMISEVNIGHEPSYGTDPWTQKAHQVFKKNFGSDVQVFFTFNGTAANVLSLRAMNESYQSVLCSDVSHINNDECSSPEILAQTKIIPVKSHQGKLTVGELNKHFIRRGDQHFSQAQTLSITQPTEVGTLYSLEELKELCQWAKSKNMFIHMDGARIANAAYRLDLPWSAFTTDLGIDVVSFGGSKNGLMFGEAILFLNPKLAQNFKFTHKQFCQLPSKSRFIAAQFLAYFENDLWKSIAKNSCDQALSLFEKCRKIPGVEVTQTVNSNAVFVKIPRPWIKPLREKYFFYVWDESTFECRWICSWDTTESDVSDFIQKIQELSDLDGQT